MRVKLQSSSKWVLQNQWKQKLPFTKTLLLHWIIFFSSTAQTDEYIEKNWSFKKAANVSKFGFDTFQKDTQNFDMENFLLQIAFDYCCFWIGSMSRYHRASVTCLTNVAFQWHRDEKKKSPKHSVKSIASPYNVFFKTTYLIALTENKKKREASQL